MSIWSHSTIRGNQQHTIKFGQALATAAPDLLIFVLYNPEPANNHSERAMRFVVDRRNARMQVCSLPGMWWCSVLRTASGRGGCAAPRYAASCDGA